MLPLFALQHRQPAKPRAAERRREARTLGLDPTHEPLMSGSFRPVAQETISSTIERTPKTIPKIDISLLVTRP